MYGVWIEYAGQFVGYIAEAFSASRGGYHSAHTQVPALIKHWKTRAGAERAAEAFERLNPGYRCFPID